MKAFFIILAISIASTVSFCQSMIEFHTKDTVLYINRKKDFARTEITYEIVNSNQNTSYLLNLLYYIIDPICDTNLAVGLYYEIVDQNRNCHNLSFDEQEWRELCYLDSLKRRIVCSKLITTRSRNAQVVRVDSTFRTHSYLYLPALYKGRYLIKLKYYYPYNGNNKTATALPKYSNLFFGSAESNEILLIVK